MRSLVILGVFLLSFVLIQPNNAQADPAIDYEVTPYKPRAGELVTFNTTNSNIWANSTFGILYYYIYSWNFGDGSPVTEGDIVTHTYTNSGNYTITMTTTDKTTNQSTGSSQRELTVLERTPIITFSSVNSERIQIGQDAIINGNLTDDQTGKGVPNENLQLFYSTTPWVETWQELGSVTTDSDGKFSLTWKPPESNKYQMKATWAGNASFPQSSSYFMFSVMKLGDLITGFTSNSTITNLSYNLTTQKLTFAASGPNGTTGYVNITLKKDTAFNPQNIIVELDNQTIPYTYFSVDDNTWLVSINYSHSTHNVSVSLLGSTVPELPAVFAVLFIALATLAVILSRKYVTQLNCNSGSSFGSRHQMSVRVRFN